MKSVRSLGGPLIGLDRKNLTRWSGIDKKNFFRNEVRFANDYDALISLEPRAVDVCKMSGDGVDCVLITMPLETAVISVSDSCIQLAQVQYADTDWDFFSITADYFEIAKFIDSDSVIFHTRSCQFIFFDAASVGIEIGDDYLSFPLNEGTYRFSATSFLPDDRTGLILYKITKVNDQ